MLTLVGTQQAHSAQRPHSLVGYEDTRPSGLRGTLVERGDLPQVRVQVLKAGLVGRGAVLLLVKCPVPGQERREVQDGERGRDLADFSRVL
jgi:hypothetical protein